MIRSAKRPSRQEGGFTLIEVVVAVSILALIIVPLTTSLIRALQQNTAVTDRLSRSADAQRIGAAWTKDVQSLDHDGPDVHGICAGKRPEPPVSEGTRMITFYWDLASTNAGATPLVPKSATWVFTGSGDNISIYRRYCEGDKPVSEQLLATKIGKPGATGTDVIHGPNGAGDLTFCPPGAGGANSTCTLVIDGSFKYTVEATRRVPGVTTVVPRPGQPVCAAPTPGNHMLSDTWTAPTGNVPITGYHVEAWTDLNGTVAASVDVSAVSNAADITGLSNLQSYWIVVYAFNDNGNGAGSVPCGPASPSPSLPGIPATVTAAPGPISSPLQVDVNWTAPLDTGGATIDQYEVDIFDNAGAPAGTKLVSGLTTSMTGLNADTTYTVQVKAHNSVGWGAPSDPVTADTRPPKPVVTQVQAANGKALVTFTVSGNGNVNLADTNAVQIVATCVTGTPTPCNNATYNLNITTPTSPNGTFQLDTGGTALLTGRAYQFTVALMNVDGNYGPASDLSANSSATTIGAPDVPTLMDFEPYGLSQVVYIKIGPVANMSGTIGNNFNDKVTGFKIKNVESGDISSLIPVDPNNPNAQIKFGWASHNSAYAATGNYLDLPNTNFVDFTEYHFALSSCNAFACSAFSTAHRGTPAVDAVQNTPSISNQQALKVTTGFQFVPGYGSATGTIFKTDCFRTAVVGSARTFTASIQQGILTIVGTGSNFVQTDVGATVTGTGIQSGTLIASVTDATHAALTQAPTATNAAASLTVTPQAELGGYPMFLTGAGSVTGPTSGLTRGEHVYCTVFASTRVTGTSYDATHSYDDTFGLGGQTQTTGDSGYIYTAPTAVASVPAPVGTNSGGVRTLTFTPVQGGAFDSGGTDPSVKYRVNCSLNGSNDSAYGSSTVVLSPVNVGTTSCQISAVNVNGIAGPTVTISVTVT